MLRESWKRPALQQSEAVLLPAIRTEDTEGRDGFVPAWDVPIGGAQTTALSTYVRPRGSIAGRSVLKAAGVSLEPYPRRGQPHRGRPAARSLWTRKKQNSFAKRFAL